MKERTNEINLSQQRESSTTQNHVFYFKLGMKVWFSTLSSSKWDWIFSAIVVQYGTAEYGTTVVEHIFPRQQKRNWSKDLMHWWSCRGFFSKRLRYRRAKGYFGDIITCTPQPWISLNFSEITKWELQQGFNALVVVLPTLVGLGAIWGTQNISNFSKTQKRNQKNDLVD